MTDGTEQLPPAQSAYWQPPVAAVPGPPQPVPDWEALADQHQEDARRRRRRQLLAGGAALAAVVVAAGVTAVVKGASGADRPSAAASVDGSASASPLEAVPVPGEPSASAAVSGAPAGVTPSAARPSSTASGARSGSAAPSPTRAPVTTPTVPGKPGLIADHTGQNNLTLGPDAAVKQVDGGWVFGGRGTAGSYAQAPGRVVDTARSFTVSAWVVNDAAAGSRSVISQGDGAASSFDLGREDAGGQKSWSFRVQTGASESVTVRATVPGAAATGKFTLLTASYDASSHTVTLYVDGTAAGSAKATAVWAGSGPLQLGRSRTGGTWGNAWTGVIGHVQVFDRALGAAEAAKIKSNGGPGFPAQADWLV